MALIGAAGFVYGGYIFETLTHLSVEYPRSPKPREELVTVRGRYENIERLCLSKSSDMQYWCGDIITGFNLKHTTARMQLASFRDMENLSPHTAGILLPFIPTLLWFSVAELDGLTPELVLASS